jgi:beta-lactamase regulating signal transducer with metallopeptidase domain
MNLTFYVPLICALAVTAAAAVIARRASPRPGAVALVAAALAAAIAADTALAVLVAARLLDAAPVAALLRWRAEAPRPIPVPVPVSLIAAGALVALAAAAAVDWRRAERSIRRVRKLHANALPGELIVVRSPDVLAHALPAMGASPGRIIVSDAMLRALDPSERRAMLAHERSHLAHRHDRYRRLVRIAARINPLVRPAVPATDFLLERWADEDAARAVGSRRLIAQALARAAVSAPRNRRYAEASFAAQRVTARVEALLAPSAGSRVALGLAVALATAAVLSAVGAGHELAHLFDLLRGDG